MSKILGILKRRQISGVTKLFILFPMFLKRSTLAPMSCPCGEILEKRWLCSLQKATSTWRFIFFEISWQNLYLSTFPGSGTNGEEFEVALPNDRSAGKRISITIYPISLIVWIRKITRRKLSWGFLERNERWEWMKAPLNSIFYSSNIDTWFKYYFRWIK